MHFINARQQEKERIPTIFLVLEQYTSLNWAENISKNFQTQKFLQIEVSFYILPFHVWQEAKLSEHGFSNCAPAHFVAKCYDTVNPSKKSYL